jgi:catechol 2,3-dioxygenase-like lactoylglutathione lyase family enzyme
MEAHMLRDFSVHPSLATSDLDRARAWYEQKLGLTPEATFDGVVVYRLGGKLFTVYVTPSAGTAQNTVAGWTVRDIRAEVARLRARGVTFEDYDFGELKTVDGVAEVGGGLSAWFKDPDGNTFGIAQSLDDPAPGRGIGAVVAAADLSRARAFYADGLGLPIAWEAPGMVGFTSGASGLTAYETSSAGTARNTVAVWRVRDLPGLVEELRGRGVVFEDYDFGDVRTLDGILTDSDGSSNAWFKDTEGNILGLAEDIAQPMR